MSKMREQKNTAMAMPTSPPSKAFRAAALKFDSRSTVQGQGEDRFGNTRCCTGGRRYGMASPELICHHINDGHWGRNILHWVSTFSCMSTPEIQRSLWIWSRRRRMLTPEKPSAEATTIARSAMVVRSFMMTILPRVDCHLRLQERVTIYEQYHVSTRRSYCNGSADETSGVLG
ncbi:hypothetical protein EJ03DRAFT_35756 [Teratosphaeria nubilosa]|uniref:Uncharacterized protein n=1 Tax=Teratosphaeria nubilosa TaxID=161662 RepID=A0A6G1KU52_9PEZI|nr:hypothetical protein EJ03DRAFT_35756 [Teratosphaeria nubilosa]